MEPPLNHWHNRKLRTPRSYLRPLQAHKSKRKAGSVQAAVGVRVPMTAAAPPSPLAQAGLLALGTRTGSVSCWDAVTGEQRWNTHVHDRCAWHACTAPAVCSLTGSALSPRSYPLARYFTPRQRGLLSCLLRLASFWSAGPQQSMR
jgi:hypothetical protein